MFPTSGLFLTVAHTRFMRSATFVAQKEVVAVRFVHVDADIFLAQHGKVAGEDW